MSVSEEQLSAWAQGPDQVEQDNCDRSVAAVTDALREDYGYRLRIFAQGSYRNRTNVRRESDVDIAVVDKQTYFSAFPGVPPDVEARVRRGLGPADWSFAQFKSAILARLVQRFGVARVQRRNKCLFISRVYGAVSADVVPAFVHRRYGQEGSVVAEGIELEADDGSRHDSFPEQHYANGVAKHERTSRQFKKMVRIMKNVRNKFGESNFPRIGVMPSFFIESLVYNASDTAFRGGTYGEELRSVLQDLWSKLGEEDADRKLVEVNGLKWLLVGNHTRPLAKEFVGAVWSYVGL